MKKAASEGTYRIQKTVFIRLSIDKPLWFLSISISRELIPPSIRLFVDDAIKSVDNSL